jgi:hypothetical protein
MTRFVRKEICLTFAAIPDRRGRFPAISFLESLGPRERGQFGSLARLMDRAHTNGFAFSGRVTKIKGSNVGLLELRVTAPHGVSPHVRLFAVIRGDFVYLAFGYSKKDQALDRSVIAKSERLVADWEAEADADKGEDVSDKKEARQRSRRADPSGRRS